VFTLSVSSAIRSAVPFFDPEKNTSKGIDDIYDVRPYWQLPWTRSYIWMHRSPGREGLATARAATRARLLQVACVHGACACGVFLCAWQVVEDLRRKDAADPAFIQRIIRNGQQFAVK
jgi:hypothetical protein